jgi:adenine-specific DNA-methyltransferase
MISDKNLNENEEYLTQQLITYIGNKRALLSFIEKGIIKVQKRLNKKKLKMFDVFSGSGIVARFFKRFSDLLIVNDLEKYSCLVNECYLSNESELNLSFLQNCYRELRAELAASLKKGIISELYAPIDDDNIKISERVFFTSRNAMYIDTARQLIMNIPESEQKYFLAPLLSEASIHTNTAGIFKGFYKNRETGIGQFGGLNQKALLRIKGNINLPFPVFSNFNCSTVIYNDDSNKILANIPELDIAYLDPPYNQHPYGSNYFMLNLILNYEYPKAASVISGIPKDWNRSAYNNEKKAFKALKEIVENLNAKFIMISFNSEGFIKLEQMENMLKNIGKLEVLRTKYNAFRGSRNLNEREIHVNEFLFLLEK